LRAERPPESLQKEALLLCGDLDIPKLTKNSLIYTVYFRISVCGGLELSLGG